MYVEDLCDNIGLVLVCLPSGSIDVAASPSQYMIQPSGIPILSPVLFMHVGDPHILNSKYFLFTCMNRMTQILADGHVIKQKTTSHKA